MTRLQVGPDADSYDGRRAYYLGCLTDAERSWEHAQETLHAAERQLAQAAENCRLAQLALEQFHDREGDGPDDVDAALRRAVTRTELDGDDAGARIRRHGISPESILANLMANAPADPEVQQLISWTEQPTADTSVVLRLLREAAAELDHDDAVAERQAAHDRWLIEGAD